MPRVQGDGFLHVSDVDYVIPFDEPLLEYSPNVPDEIATRIGRYVARIVEDGDTIQVGYGSVPNAIMSALGRKKHLGVHTELLTDGLVDLIRQGVIDNSRKTVNRGKTITSLLHGEPRHLRVHRRQPDHRVQDDRLHEQPARHRPARATCAPSTACCRST